MSSPKWPRVILLGDSNTQYGFSSAGCWVSLLANKLQRKCDIFNRGFAGYNTRNFKDLIDQIVTEDLIGDPDRVKAVTIFLGANDSVDPNVTPSTHQNVPLDEYKDNLKFIVQYLETRGITKDKIILIPTPPCDPWTWEEFVKVKYGYSHSAPSKPMELAKIYHDAGLEIASSLQLDVVKLWDDLKDPDCFEDGLHFSEKGATRLFELLIPEFEKRIPVDTPFMLPEWRVLSKPD